MNDKTIPDNNHNNNHDTTNHDETVTDQHLDKDDNNGCDTKEDSALYEDLMQEDKEDSAPTQDDIEDLLDVKQKKFSFQPIWIIYALGASLLIYGAYNVFFGLSSTDSQPTPSTVKSNTDSFAANQQNLPAKQTLPLESTVSNNTQAVSIIDKKIVQLQHSIEALSNSLSTLDKSVTAAVKQQATQSQKFDTLQKSITTLTNKPQAQDVISQLQQSIEQQSHTLKALSDEFKSMQVDKLAITHPFHLTAITAQYAWLSDAQGRILSISQGDTLTGYGTVLKIDHDHNKVYLSSGYVFQ